MHIIKCTSRGQVTLPKKWRDKVKTTHFLVEMDGDDLILKPVKQKTFAEILEEGWQSYKAGNYITHEELKKKYGL